MLIFVSLLKNTKSFFVLQINSIANDLASFMVNPTETTIYTITSNGICGGPEPAGFGEEFVIYEVIVDNNCGAPPVRIDEKGEKCSESDEAIKL